MEDKVHSAKQNIVHVFLFTSNSHTLFRKHSDPTNRQKTDDRLHLHVDVALRRHRHGDDVLLLRDVGVHRHAVFLPPDVFLHHDDVFLRRRRRGGSRDVNALKWIMRVENCLLFVVRGYNAEGQKYFVKNSVYWPKKTVFKT